MDGNPEGTPNPLNPMSGSVDTDDVVQPATFTRPVNYSEANDVPAKTSTPIPEATPASEPTFEPEPVHESAPVRESIPVSTPHVNHSVVDPMMRPVARRTETAPTNTVDDIPAAENFDTLGMDSSVMDELTSSHTDTASTQNLVAKDSIVEPAKGGNGKKRGLIIGAIVFLMVAIICGAAAIAIMMLGNNDDRVSKAIDKLINGGLPNIITVQGDISSTTNGASDITSLANSFSIDFKGTFDTSSSLNKVEAGVNATLTTGQEVSLDVEEMRTKDGNTFFKVSGLKNLLNSGSSDTLELNTTKESTAEITLDCVNTNCSDGDTCTDNCMSVQEPQESVLSMYSGLFDVVDNQWIMVSDTFARSMSGSELFDNSSTCLINAFGTLSQYSSDIAKKYKENPFVTYSTDNLEIAKKKDNLYRLGIDSSKASAFANSLSNNGFINELNACTGNTATNVNVSSSAIDKLFANFPTVYIEVDENSNITRVYLKTIIESDGASTTVKADLGLSYPAEVKITEPTEYTDMSTLLSAMMSELFNGVSLPEETSN